MPYHKLWDGTLVHEVDPQDALASCRHAQRNVVDANGISATQTGTYSSVDPLLQQLTTSATVLRQHMHSKGPRQHLGGNTKSRSPAAKRQASPHLRMPGFNLCHSDSKACNVCDQDGGQEVDSVLPPLDAGCLRYAAVHHT